MFFFLRLSHILPILLWLTHLCLLFFKIHIKFIDNYLDDLVVLPIILGISTIIQQKFITNNSFTVNYKTIIYSWLYFCIVFECIIPRFNRHFTTDWFDCIAYGIGALYFVCFQNKPIKPKI